MTRTNAIFLQFFLVHIANGIYYFQPLNETQKLNICIQAAEGMNYLEAEQIVHKDIAARNCWYVLRNEFKFWNVHGTMNTSGLLQNK